MANESKSNFFSNLLSSLFGSNDADAEKKRQLKAIAKRLSKSRYNKFYKYSGNELLPPFAKLFYEIYKAIFPLQALFNSIQNQQLLKAKVIDFMIPENIKTLEESLREEKIQEMSHTLGTAQLREQAEKRLTELSDFFTLEKITEIDNLYKQVAAIKIVSTFDYYFFLKKFDKTIQENSFSQAPHFEHVNAEYLSDDLKDYVEAIWDIPFDADWTNAFKFLKELKGTEPVSIGLWKKLMARLYSLKQTMTLEMIIQLSSSNPGYTPQVQTITSNIVEPYLDQIKNDVENTLYQITEKERSDTENNFASQLFGETEIVPLANFNESKNPTFERKGLMLYENTQALTYMKTFLMEVVKKDFREFYDVVVVRGQWDSQTLTSQISESYNSLVSTLDKIITFDNEMSDEGPIGIKIKTLLIKTDRDKSSKNIVNRLIFEANENAYIFVMESTRNIITIGKILKTLVDDLNKPKATLIANWKDVEPYLEVPLKDFCINIYKKIYLFTSLIKTCVTQPENVDSEE